MSTFVLRVQVSLTVLCALKRTQVGVLIYSTADLRLPLRVLGALRSFRHRGLLPAQAEDALLELVLLNLHHEVRLL